MNGNELHNRDDFDEVLFDTIPELSLQPEMVNQVTPWRKNINLILFGFVANTFSIDIWYWRDITTYLGLILMFLGLWRLRKENNWFRSAGFLCLIRIFITSIFNCLDATIWQNKLSEMPIAKMTGYVNILIIPLILLCLFAGFRSVQMKAGISPRWKIWCALFLWYGILFALAYFEFMGWILFFCVLISYGFIIYHIYKLSKEMDDAGYAITPAPVRIPNLVIFGVILALQIGGIILGYTHFNKYPMDWKVVSTETSADINSIQSHLVKLGFPEAFLKDMKEEDIKAISNAKKVIMDDDYFPINDGREVLKETISFWGDPQISHEIVYDQKEFHMTSIAVQLNKEGTKWQMIHRFNWVIHPGFKGTDAIAIMSDKYPAAAKRKRSTVSGQILYDSNNTTYISDFYQVKKSKENSNNPYEFKAMFSFPNDVENCRGYLTYQTTIDSFDTPVYSQADYYHQKSQWQYPVTTVYDHLKNFSLFSSDDIFIHLQKPFAIDAEEGELF